MVDPDEQHALECLRRSDSRGFDYFFDRLHAPVWAFALRLSRRADVADDVAQLAWMRLAERAPSLAADTQVRSWMLVVVRNIYLSRLRREQIEQHLGEGFGRKEIEPPSGPPAAHESVLSHESIQEIEAAVMALPLKLREPILLVAVHGLTPLEAATVLGLRPEALRQRLHRGRDFLRPLLERKRR